MIEDEERKKIIQKAHSDYYHYELVNGAIHRLKGCRDQFGKSLLTANNLLERFKNSENDAQITELLKTLNEEIIESEIFITEEYKKNKK